jgi:hypothetical protein
MFTPYHLHQAREWARQEGFELVKKDRIRDFSAQHAVSLYDLRSYADPARFLEFTAAKRVEEIAHHLRRQEAVVETVGSDPDSRFRVYRTTARIIMPG